MITTAVASPAIDSGTWLRQHRVSFPSGFWSGLPSASKKFFPLTSTLYPIEKVVVRSFRASESHIQGRDPAHPVATKFNAKIEAVPATELLKNTDSATATFEDVNVLDRGTLSNASASREERNPERLNSTTAKSNKADFLPVVRFPLLTESAIKAILESNTFVFVVDKRADKKNIKETVEKMFMTRAKKVNTLIMPDGTKKAYIMLASDCNAVDVAKKIKIL